MSANNILFLWSTLPIQYVTKGDNEHPIIDKIVRVCCALCNVCDSVVPFYFKLLYSSHNNVGIGTSYHLMK